MNEPPRATRAVGGDPAAGGRRGGDEEPPPLLGSWGALYALVIAGLLLMIALCGAITWWAS